MLPAPLNHSSSAGLAERLEVENHHQEDATKRITRNVAKTEETTSFTTALNSFEKNGDGGGPSECDNKYHSDDLPVVALSTGWFGKRKRCHNYIKIHGNGKSVKAMVVDECDSTKGCDKPHDYQPPCRNNIVDASKAVWEALGVPHGKRETLDIYWSDA